MEPTAEPPVEGLSPFDTPTSASLRFTVEVLAWTAGAWAATEWWDTGWAALPAAIVLIALPAVFSTPGDKKQVIVPTPGPLRLVIEVVLAVVAVAGSWAAWPAWLAVIVTVVVAAALVTGVPRARWLLRGAPDPG